MQRFYTPSGLIDSGTVTIEGDEYHHATRSCRVRTGELIGVTDGCGRYVIARIDTIDRERVVAVIERDVSGAGEPDALITLALSVIHQARFETAVEKCTELGVRRIVPVVAERCERGTVRRIRTDRLERIALGAVKQSGRSWMPDIGEPVAFSHLLDECAGSVCTASQLAEAPFAEACREHVVRGVVTLLVGPEGDFSEDEHGLLLEAGASFFTLGGLVLRAETAAIAATVEAVAAVRTVH